MGIFRTKQGKTIIFIDEANMHYALREAGWQIDFHRLYNFLQDELGHDFEVNLYEGYFPDKSPGLQPLMDENGKAITETKKQRKFRFFEKLRKFGYKIETKPIGSVYDFTTGERQHKCNFDVEIAITALDKIDHFKTFVFFSGDGDFTKLIKYLKGKFKHTIVLSTKKRVSDSLRKAANQFINLNAIRNKIERK